MDNEIIPSIILSDKAENAMIYHFQMPLNIAVYVVVADKAPKAVILNEWSFAIYPWWDWVAFTVQFLDIEAALTAPTIRGTHIIIAIRSQG